MNYRVEIDGLRALAVLAVIFYHTELGCSGGYVGVDVFFVISGYLICEKISREVEAGTFRYREFWMRRVRRLLPALALMLAVVVPVSVLLLLPTDLAELGLTVGAQPLMIANVVFWRLVFKSYFGLDPETRPTMHTWSLAVEEQFYLLCPLLLARFGGGRRVPVLLGIALSSWLLSGLASESKPAFCYFLLPTRAFEIALGGLVHTLTVPRAWAAREGLCLIAWMGLAFSLLCLNEDTVFPGWVALIPCLAAALLLLAARRGTWSSRLLTLPPLVWVGKISYSVYLWHWPLIAFWRYLFLPWGLPHRLLLVVLSVLAGFASTVLVENRVRARLWLASDGALLRAALVFATLCLGSGAGLWLARGFPQRYSPASLQFLRVETGSRPNLSLEALRRRQFFHFGASAGRRLFVWGDSHAMAVLGGLDEGCREAGVSGEAATQFNRPPFICAGTKKQRFDPSLEKERVEFVKEYLRENPPEAVLLAGRWSGYPDVSGLAGTLEFLQARRIPTWILLEVPDQGVSVPRRLAREAEAGKDLSLSGVPIVQYRKDTADFVRQLDQLAFPLSRRLEPAALLVNTAGVCRTVADGASLYVDDSHLSLAGSRFVKPIFKPLLRRPF